MAARPPVYRDEAVDAGVLSLLAPFPLGDVVIDMTAGGMDPVAHPTGIPQRGDEKTDPFLQGDRDPFHHALVISPRRGLDERVHAHRLGGEPPDVPEPFAELVAMDVRERNRLDDPDAAGIGDRGDQLRIAARVHGAADQRHLDSRVSRESSDHR